MGSPRTYTSSQDHIQRWKMPVGEEPVCTCWFAGYMGTKTPYDSESQGPQKLRGWGVVRSLVGQNSPTNVGATVVKTLFDFRITSVMRVRQYSKLRLGLLGGMSNYRCVQLRCGFLGLLVWELRAVL